MKKISLLFVLLAACCIILVSCDKTNETNFVAYNLSLTATDGGEAFFENFSGSSINLSAGNSVTVVALPDNGYKFVGWCIAGTDIFVSSYRVYTFNVREVLSLTAIFEKDDKVSVETVDLGLSVKWGSCNVGATSPEEYGIYCAWGENAVKDNYAWSSYKWWSYDGACLIAYCTDGLYGVIDGKSILESYADVAFSELGGRWRMPTHAEQDELLNDCVWEWTLLNGVCGYKVIGPNGNSIFLPAAGYRSGDKYYNREIGGYYWSNSLDTDCNNNAFYVVFSGDAYGWGRFHERCVGMCVRPVYK